MFALCTEAHLNLLLPSILPHYLGHPLAEFSVRDDQQHREPHHPDAEPACHVFILGN